MSSGQVLFDWDEANILRLARHHVSPGEVEQCYLNDPLILEDQWIGHEERYLALSETNSARRLAFVFTIRRGMVRIITAYPMTPGQQAVYDEG